MISLPLHGFHMQKDRMRIILDLGERVDQARKIVAIDRPQVLDPQRLEHLPGPDKAFDPIADHVPGPFDRMANAQRQFVHKALAEPLGLFVGLADADALEILGERALGMADAHAVVVEDDQHLAFERAGGIEALEGHPLTIDESPTTATTSLFRFRVWSPLAIPTAVLMAVPACPTAKRSKGDSSGDGKPETLPFFRRRGNWPARPVSILCA